MSKKTQLYRLTFPFAKRGIPDIIIARRAVPTTETVGPTSLARVCLAETAVREDDDEENEDETDVVDDDETKDA